MAEKTLFLYTNGFTGDSGDGAAAYTEEEFRAYNHAALAGEVANAGVLSGVLNELAVSGSTSPLSVATGRAILYGFHYQNLSSAVSLSVTTPSIGDTGGRVVVRVNLTSSNTPPSENTGRARVIMNTDGTAAIPAMTQTAATTWDIPLATFVIDTSGNIWTDSSKTVAGVSDVRQFAISPLSGMVRLRRFAGDGVSTSFTWSGIQGDLSGLLIVGYGRSTNAVGTANNLEMVFNGDTGSNYDTSLITGNNGTVAHSLNTGVAAITLGNITNAGGTADAFDQYRAQIHNYANAVGHKTAEIRSMTKGDNAAGNKYSRSIDAWWRNTAAINKITISLTPGGAFASGSLFELFGIR